MDKKDYPNGVIDIDGNLYKLIRYIDKNEEDIHHIISRKERNKFNVNIERNLLKIKRRTHDALNRLFGWNNQNPKKQLEFMYEIWKDALSPWVRQELYVLFTLPDEMFYHKDLLKWEHKKKKEKK